MRKLFWLLAALSMFAFEVQAETLFIGDDNGNVAKWDTNTNSGAFLGTVDGPVSQSLGLAYDPTSNRVLILDRGLGNVWEMDSNSGASALLFTTPGVVFQGGAVSGGLIYGINEGTQAIVAYSFAGVNQGLAGPARNHRHALGVNPATGQLYDHSSGDNTVREINPDGTTGAAVVVSSGFVEDLEYFGGDFLIVTYSSEVLLMDGGTGLRSVYLTAAQTSALGLSSNLSGVTLASPSAYVYRTETCCGGPAPLHEYDVANDTWSNRAPLPSTNYSQLAVDENSVLHALPADGNVYSYDRPSDTWSFVQVGPAASVGAGIISMFEAHNGEFYWADDGTSTLHYTTGGVWNSIASPHSVSSGSGIDRVNDKIFIRTYGELGFMIWDIGTSSFLPSCDDTTNVGENSRMGAFFGGYFYSRTWDGPITEFDVNTCVGLSTGTTPLQIHSASDVDGNGMLYLNGYGPDQNVFEVFDIGANLITSLAPAPNTGSGNPHPTIAVVGSSSAPVNNPPVADAGPDQTVECTGDPNTTVQLNGSGSYDPDAGDSIAMYFWTGGTFNPNDMVANPTVDVPLGVHVFGLQVFDTFGLDDSDSVQVTVSDTVEPVIVAPADISEQHTAHPHYIADLGTPSVTEACGYTVSNDAPAGNLFPLGLTVVTWTVTDTAGNTSSDTQDVLVLNTEPVADDQSPVFVEDSVANVITLTASDINNDSPLVFAVVGGSGPSHGTLGGAAPNLTYTPDANYFGPDEFRFTAMDEHGAVSAEATVSITVTPVNDPPVISISRATATVQYSDTIGTVTITATDVDDDPLALSSEYTDNGGAPIAGLPSNLGIAGSCTTVPNDTTSPGTTCSWDLTGQMLEDAGDYDITFTVTDGGGGEGTIESDSGATEIIVNPEDASISFDENNEVAIQVDGDGSDSSLPFSLTVYIDETEPDIATFIAMYGDLSLAVPHMVLTPVGPGGPEGPDSCDTSVAGIGYDQVMTYTCHFSGVPVNTYSVDVNVDGGYYIGENDDVFTVFDPSLGFTTGGGWFYWPGTNDKTNFGYTMKYNKKRTNLQGSLLMIRHVEGSTTGEKWRIKSNALEGLAIGSDPDFGWAAFSGKATYRSPTEDNEGNNEFTVYVEDHGVPGKGVDQFWVQTRDKQDDVRPDLSMPEPGAGNTETIEGGNIFVPHSGGGGGKGPKK